MQDRTINGLKVWMQWVVANTVGELIGLGTVAVVGLLLSTQWDATTSPLLVVGFAGLMIRLGAFEGAVLGVAQWLVLRGVLPGLAMRSWVLATLLGAAVAWTLGMVPSSMITLTAGPETPPPPEMRQGVVLLLASGMGAVLGMVLAVPQWLVLQRFVRRARWWLVANVLSWACGMPLVFHAAGAMPEGAALAHMVTILLVTIGLAGGVVGAVHGVALVLLVRTNIPTL